MPRLPFPSPLLVVPLLAALAALALPSPAGAVVSPAVPAQSAPLLREAEDSLMRVTTLSAGFIQITSTGESAEGRLEISRPGRMRIDYAPPSPVLVIANGLSLIYIDRELNEATYVGLDSSPAGILLRKTVSFADPDITVTGVRHRDGVVEVDVVMTADPTAGMLTMIFSDKPFELRQWRMKDAQGVVTTLTLNDVHTGVSFPDKDFTYDKPTTTRAK